MNQLLRSLLIPVTLVLLISLSDCIRFGSSLLDDDEAVDPTETPTPTLTPFATPWPTPTPRVSPTPTPEPTPTPTPTVSDDDLSELLIDLDDLPVGWTAVDVDEPPTQVPGAEEVDGTLVSSFFQRGDLGPFFVHMLFYAESEADAEAAFEAIEEELDAADILDDMTDQVRSWETRPLAFDDFGDETFAFKAIGDTGLIPVEADMVTTRKGQYISFVIYAELMVADTERTIELVEMSVERLPEPRSVRSFSPRLH